MFHFDGTARPCLGPKATRAPQLLRLPLGSWDTHAHVIGASPAWPLVADRHYTPPAAAPGDFMDMLDTVGVTHGVLVQVSVHGADNRLLVQALQAQPERLRGVAVIDSKTTDAELAELQQAGVVGVRMLDIVGGGQSLSGLESTASRCAELGWHVQLGARGENYPALLPRLMKLKVPFVMDHMGWCAASAGVQHPHFQAVLDLARNADCRVKLSGAFRLSSEEPEWADTIPMAQALIEAAPDRVFWGSDWPHVGLYDEAALPAVGDLLDLLARTVPDADVQRSILVDNPTRFYGRPGAKP
ncbi:MAG TPA: amidohydrolase family protein [Ramlibacter sp.]|nr:amidohydrolase family protein [Ramlibacter sp.]